MFDALFRLLAPPAPAAVCVLPAPVPQKPKAPPAPKASGVYVENEETRTFGFRMERESDRVGAVPHLTAADRAELEGRDLWGGTKVIAQNQAAKRAWHDGRTVAQCAATLGRSESWVEKRFAAFSTALSGKL